MKSYKLIFFILLVAGFGLSGCDLLVNQKPAQSLTDLSQLNNVSTLKGALTGAYDHLQTTGNGDNFGEVLFTQEYLTSDAVFVGSFPTFQQIAQRQMTASNGSITDMWNGAYRDINDANIILSKIPKLRTAPKSVKDNIKGQALFLRALNYYYLLKLFALPASAGESNMGVPLQLKAVTSQKDFRSPSRSSIGDVYKQIVKDLQNAHSLLPSVAGGNPRNRANREAAAALLARIALVRGNYQAAADWSDSVITSGNFKLYSDVKFCFRHKNSKEAIFTIQNTKQDVPDAANTSITAGWNPHVRNNGEIGPAFTNAIKYKNELNSRQRAEIKAQADTAIDTRVSELVAGSYTNKYEDVQNAADNVPILRYPEMILTRAEALARVNGVNQKSIDLLNQIRERAFNVIKNGKVNKTLNSLVDYEMGDFSSKQDLINVILHERFVELAFEGHRKEDLERTKRDVGIGKRALPYNSPKLVYPIPQTQIDANHNIKQNPGY